MLNSVHISAKQHTIFRSACCSPKQKVKYFNVLFILFMKVCLQDMKANSIVMCYIRMHVHEQKLNFTIHKVKKNYCTK